MNNFPLSVGYMDVEVELLDQRGGVQRVSKIAILHPECGTCRIKSSLISKFPLVTLATAQNFLVLSVEGFIILFSLIRRVWWN